MWRIASLLFALLVSIVAHSQQVKDTRPMAERLWFGGSMLFSFGTVTYVQLDPMVGYKVDQKGKLMVGTGPSFWYFEDRRFTPSRSFTGYGYRIFSRYRFIEQAYAHAEFLNFNIDGARNELFGPLDRRIWVPHLLLGAGYVQRMGDRSGVFAQVLFEVLQDPNSIYYGQGPIFSIGVGFGF